jgi:hypothetical protein
VWYAKLTQELGAIDFKPSLTDPCLFVKGATLYFFNLRFAKFLTAGSTNLALVDRNVTR